MGRRSVKFRPAKGKKPDDPPPEEDLLVTPSGKMMTPYSGIIQKYVNDDNWVGDSHHHRRMQKDPIFGTSRLVDEELIRHSRQHKRFEQDEKTVDEVGSYNEYEQSKLSQLWARWNGQKASKLSDIRARWDRSPAKEPFQRLLRLSFILLAAFSSKYLYKNHASPRIQKMKEKANDPNKLARPRFVYEHPYVTSSYYTATSNIEVLEKTKELQIEPKKDRLPDRERGIVSRLAILRPFCEFDAEALPVTFACWNSLVPCRAAEMDLGDEDEEIDEWVLFDMSVNGTGRRLEKEEEDNWDCEAEYESDGHSSSWIRGIANSLIKRCKRKPRVKAYFDDVSADGLRTTSADLFLFYSQTFSENDEAMVAVDKIMEEFYSPGGWSRCFDNIYAVEANIPMELDLYIPAAQEELYSWVNGPNRQYEAGFRIIQSGEWGDYDGFYLMEGDSVPVKNYWLDVILGEINAYRPFAVLGAQYDGDKWDAFYEDIPISLLHHTNGNGIYNVSHPLLERLTGQLEVEAACPYNSIPYDYRMSQMWVEGTLGIVPTLAPKIMLNEEGENITLSNNLPMFSKWANRWNDEEPYKFTKAIHNYAATNLIPRHLGPEYVIHGAKLYSPWDPARTQVTLVISEWFFDRSLNLIKDLDNKDHPFSKVIIMIPPSVSNGHDYSKYTSVPVTLQFRDTPDTMDLCAAEVKTEWYMITNSYHHVSRHVDLMFTPGKFVPVVPFTPATYPFCLKYPYCKEIIMLSQRWNQKHKQVVQDMDMLYHTKERNAFCAEWIERNGANGEDLYAKHQPLRWQLREEKIIGPKGPTGTDYLAYLIREKKEGMYKMTDRSLYGARAPFVKVYRKEEKLDGMSEDELARRLGMTLLGNTTECSCDRFETEEECLASGLGCQWRPLFESCHPPEMIDDGIPICSSTDPPTMSPTVGIDRMLQETESPTLEAEIDLGSEGADGSDAANKDSLNVLTSMFKTREHQVDAVGTSDEEGDELDGRRHLIVLSDENSTEGMPKSLDPISVSDNASPAASLLESLSRGEVVVAPTQSPYQVITETMCPTWGPSVVPRRVEELPSTDDVVYQIETFHSLNETMKNEKKHTKNTWPGRARHAQHQLVQLDPTKSLGTAAVKVPTPEKAKKRRILVNYGEDRADLRIIFDTSSLSTLLHEMGKNFASIDQYKPTNARITAYVEEVFPSIVGTWGKFLKISPSLQNLFVHDSSSCGKTLIPQEHLEEGVADADVVIYVEAREKSSCSIDSSPQITICHFDQNMRPLIGSLSICLDDMDIQKNKVYDKEILHHTALLSNLVGRFLGLSPSLFKYFRDPETGQLWGERMMDITCGYSEAKQGVLLPNIIQQRNERDAEPFYEVSTPTVKQVVRNHFDCQTLTGARLEDPSLDLDGDEKCAFYNLDLRFHFDEDMTSISQNEDAAYGVSPLSLALLEDSSWYKANFAAATTPTFGRGSGCGFVESSCITGGNVPDYSKGFFCASQGLPGASCDYTHRHKAGCDLETDANPPENNQYFLPSNPEFGSPFDDMHFCPMHSKHLVPCSSNKAMASLTGESYGESSMCFETDAMIPVCLETICNPSDKTLSIVVKGKTFYCAYHGQVINVDVGYSVVCPRIAAVCPDLVCPSNCSGKGVCDYCKEVPECICDSPLDKTAGCWES
ncbi:hypothetical protein ACHAXR_010253 [Thalassiosira sp. AJA248-18]